MGKRAQQLGVQSDAWTDCGLHSKQLNGDIRQEMKVSTTLAATVTLPLMWKEPATLEIALFNQVLIYDSARSDTEKISTHYQI